MNSYDELKTTKKALKTFKFYIKDEKLNKLYEQVIDLNLKIIHY